MLIGPFWVGIILLASNLSGHTQMGREFPTQDDCWEYYNTHPHMRRVNNKISTTRPVMLFEIKSFGLGWITCVKKYKLNRNIIKKNRRPANVLLPTPE
jgi:hypothetical protein